jgi:hypothetical protein
MKSSNQRGGARIDFVFLMAIVSCSILFTPWFITVGILLVMVWLQDCASSQERAGSPEWPSLQATPLLQQENGNDRVNVRWLDTRVCIPSYCVNPGYGRRSVRC